MKIIFFAATFSLTDFRSCEAEMIVKLFTFRKLTEEVRLRSTLLTAKNLVRHFKVSMQYSLQLTDTLKSGHL